MNQNKISSRVWTIIKSATAAAVLPVLFIYIMIAKPDYRIMNAMAHVVLPVANVVGDVVSWPIRVISNTFSNLHEISNLRNENEELRTRLDMALANQNNCEIAIAENARLNQEIDIINSQPTMAILADVRHDNTALNHSTYLISRGTKDGVATGMVVVSPDGWFAGIIIDAGMNFARVRALTDSDTNIAVRVVGTDVYGFLQGTGSETPKMQFFSDPEFVATSDSNLVTSNISGVLPAGIMVGKMIDKSRVYVMSPKRLSRVIVLKFDAVDKYK